MAEKDLAVATDTAAQKLKDGVLDMTSVLPMVLDDQKVFIYYNGPTDQLSGVSAGVAILDPGASPHPPHQHPEEEFLIIGEGSGEIECAGKITPVSTGAMMYCAGGAMHGIVNTGSVPMTFYWSKWLAKGF